MMRNTQLTNLLGFIYWRDKINNKIKIYLNYSIKEINESFKITT